MRRGVGRDEHVRRGVGRDGHVRRRGGRGGHVRDGEWRGSEQHCCLKQEGLLPKSVLSGNSKEKAGKR